MFDVQSLPPLYLWPKPLKYFLLGFLFLLTSGVTSGLVYLNFTTSMTTSGAVEHYRGSPGSGEDLLDVKDKYPKPASELLLTTHNHLIGFSFIFLMLGILFYFNSIVRGRFKTFLLVEPFVSTWLTFTSLWGTRYIHEYFIYITVTTAVLTYLSFFLVVLIVVYEVTLKKN